MSQTCGLPLSAARSCHNQARRNTLSIFTLLIRITHHGHRHDCPRHQDRLRQGGTIAKLADSRALLGTLAGLGAGAGLGYLGHEYGPGLMDQAQAHFGGGAGMPAAPIAPAPTSYDQLRAFGGGVNDMAGSVGTALDTAASLDSRNRLFQNIDEKAFLGGAGPAPRP
jgi:hypothetical protein